MGRFFNTIGPRQTGQYGMVVPRFVRRALAGEPLEVYGSGEQTRCFSNVRDVVAALIGLIDCPAAVGTVVHIGPTESISIAALADRIIAMPGSSSSKVYLSYEEAYGRPFDDMMARVPDLGRIRSLIGYQPQHDLDSTLRQVIDYEKTRL